MTSESEFDDGSHSPQRRLVTVLFALLVLALLYFAYRELTAPVTRKVKNDEAVLAVQPDLPPPPPPPPPPPQAVQRPPEPSDQQKAVAEAKPAPNSPPQQVQMDAAPSAGAGGIAAGGGSGMGAPGSTGTCIVGPCGNGNGGGGGGSPINEGFYLRTLSGELQTVIDHDRKLSRMVFDARLHITVSASGAVTRVEMVDASGKTDVDTQLVSLLRGVRNLSTPPAGIHFPLNVKVRGRRAFS